MPLLEDGRLRPDDWTSIEDEAPLPEGPAIVSLARLRAEADALAGRNAPLGVALSPETQPEEVAPFLDRLALVAVCLPKSKDGRAFTQIRALREHHGFTGEIRATGHVLPDQYAMLLRCGVTTVEVPESTDPATWTRSRDTIRIAYQAAQSADRPLSLLRRKLELA
ncbi:DUF934 domain-containing protein [Belnapia sp. T6]|uniref:DUF934 domain-containing protein n=1 Tax=Belnapia mucosa TaxID=2804532 RepID=A0ABS1V4I0_9PROT|nr:DUF934 domain-containing protein [Belnapia mucosa]MBL6456590.1 DUF934 domain-containing protein [Belnapia mucosa]